MWSISKATIKRTAPIRPGMAKSKTIERYVDRRRRPLHLRQPDGKEPQQWREGQQWRERHQWQERQDWHGWQEWNEWVQIYWAAKSLYKFLCQSVDGFFWRGEFRVQTFANVVHATAGEDRTPHCTHQRTCVGSRWFEHSSLYFLKSLLVVTCFIETCLVSLTLLLFLTTLVTESGTTCADPLGGSLFGRRAEQIPFHVMSQKTWSISPASKRRLPSLQGRTASPPTSMTFPPLLRLTSQKPLKQDSWLHHCSRRSEK